MNLLHNRRASFVIVNDAPFATPFGSVNTAIRRLTSTVESSQGPDISYVTAQIANEGSAFLINTAGLYYMSYVDSMSSAGASSVFGISRNSNQLTTAVNLITATHRLAIATTSAVATAPVICFAIARLAVGDIIRPHGDANENGDTEYGVRFEIGKISP